MNVKDVVIKFLNDSGAAGLFDNESNECSCLKSDLFLCGDSCLTECMPMYEVKCKKTGRSAFYWEKIDDALEASEFVEKYCCKE